MKKILIIGGAGFCGGNLAIHRAEQDDEVVVFDNLVRRGSELNLERFKSYKNIKFVHGDARCTEDFDNLNFKPDLVLECSAQPTAVDGYNNFRYDFTNNTNAVLNTLEFCKKNDAGIIFWSTNKVYSGDACNSVFLIEKQTRFEFENPYYRGFPETMTIDGNSHTPYGTTKLCSDLMVQEFSKSFKIPGIVNRFSCLYGPNQFGKCEQGFVAHFVLSSILDKKVNVFGFNGKQVRDCLYITDLCNLIDKQINNLSKHKGSVYNVGGGASNTTSICELINLLDIWFSKYYKMDVEFIDEPRREDQKIYVSDIKKVSNEFEWSPKVNFTQGVENLYGWTSDNLEKLVKIL